MPTQKKIETVDDLKERLERELDKAHKVIEIQSKLSALLEGLAAESVREDSERT